MAYDQSLALKCAGLSKDVYLMEGTDDPAKRFFSINGTQALMINEPSVIYVVFRGTTLEDVLADAKFRQVKTYLGGIHRGFWAYVEQVYDLIVEQCKNWDPFQRKPILFSGHSLGAAAAVIAAARMFSDGFDIDSLYTYGCPRVGNHEFKKYADSAFRDCHYRHVNANDAVTRVPWISNRKPDNWKDIGAYFDIDLYWHCGTLKYINVDGKLVDNPTTASVFLDRWSYFKRSPWKWATDGGLDHSIARYEVACELNL